MKINSLPSKKPDYYANIINQKRLNRYNGLMVKINELPYKLPFEIPKPNPIITLQDAKLDLIRKHYQSLEPEDQKDYLAPLNEDMLRFYYTEPDIFLHDKQIIEDGFGSPWMYYLLQAGRGFGKSKALSAWMSKKIRKGAKVLGMVGPTYNDVHKVQVPFIMSWFLPDEIDKYVKEEEIRFTNGAVIYIYSSDIEKKGSNLEYMWYDEVGSWCKGNPEQIKQRYKDLRRAVRIGDHPQNATSSTPKPHPFFIDFNDKIERGRPNYRMIKGSMFENPFLSDDYMMGEIEDAGFDSEARQELFGDLITDTAGAYWTHKKIDDLRCPVPAPYNIIGKPSRKLPTNLQLSGREPMPTYDPNAPYLVCTLIGFDPSGSVEGDECGIVIAALYSNKQAWVLEDCSGHYTPDQYSQIIADKYKEYQVAGVVVETNYGGKQNFEYILRTKNALMNIIPITSKQGKTTRAEHVSALYSQNKVHHTKIFRQLEEQMCRFNVNFSKSPDRLDALGFAITELFFPTRGNGQGISLVNLPSR